MASNGTLPRISRSPGANQPMTLAPNENHIARAVQVATDRLTDSALVRREGVCVLLLGLSGSVSDDAQQRER